MVVTQSAHHRANNAIAQAKARRKQLAEFLLNAGQTSLAGGLQELIANLDQQIGVVNSLSEECAFSFGQSDREEDQFESLRKAVSKLSRLSRS